MISFPRNPKHTPVICFNVFTQNQRTDAEVPSVVETEPSRQSDIISKSSVVGDDKLEDETMLSICVKYKFVQCSRSHVGSINPETWTACVDQSPILRQRFVGTSEDELRKMFRVGELTPAQVSVTQ